MTSKFVETVPLVHRQGNAIPNTMMLIEESGCTVVKSQGRLGNAGFIQAVPQKDIKTNSSPGVKPHAFKPRKRRKGKVEMINPRATPTTALPTFGCHNGSSIHQNRNFGFRPAIKAHMIRRRG